MPFASAAKFFEPSKLFIDDLGTGTPVRYLL